MLDLCRQPKLYRQRSVASPQKSICEVSYLRFSRPETVQPLQRMISSEGLASELMKAAAEAVRLTELTKLTRSKEGLTESTQSTAQVDCRRRPEEAFQAWLRWLKQSGWVDAP